MSTPVQPVVIRGPAIVIRDSMAFYTKGDIMVRPRRATFAVDSDMFGVIDQRAADQGQVDIEFTPVGQIANLAKYYPHGPNNLVAASAVGNSIYTGSDVPTVIHTLAGVTTTYHRTGIARMPALRLSPRQTLFGPMTIRALGKRGVAATNAAYLKTLGAAAFSDASFNETLVETAVYAAALGSREAPFNNLGARNGFEIEPMLDLDVAQDDNIGIADEIVAGITWRCRFAPNNLTEAQVDTLLAWQGETALIVGQSVANAGEDLVITGELLDVTLHRVGPVAGEHGYGRVDRNGTVEFATQMRFTTGAPNPLITFTL